MRTLEYNNVPLHYINYILKTPVGSTEGDYSDSTKKIRLSLIPEDFVWNDVVGAKIVGNPFYNPDCLNSQGGHTAYEETPKSGAKVPESSDLPNPVDDNITSISGGLITILFEYLFTNNRIDFNIEGCSLEIVYSGYNDVEDTDFDEVLYNGLRNDFQPTKQINDIFSKIALGNLFYNGLENIYIATTISEEELEFFNSFIELSYKPGYQMLKLRTLAEVEQIKNFDYSKIVHAGFDNNKIPFELPNHDTNQDRVVLMYDQSVPYTEIELECCPTTYPRFVSANYKPSGYFIVTTSEYTKVISGNDWQGFCEDCVYSSKLDDIVLPEIARSKHIVFTAGNEYTLLEDIQALKESLLLLTYENKDVIWNPYVKYNTLCLFSQEITEQMPWDPNLS